MIYVAISQHYCVVCNLIEMECYYRASGTVFAQASACPISIKSVTHKQVEWSIITLPFQATRNII